MKILITGGGGQVAYDLIRLASLKHFLFYAPPRSLLDICNEAQIEKVFEQFQPDIVINTAAYTQVDHAEHHPALAFMVNREGAKYLAMACAKLDCPLLHLSTDYVFSGNQTRPYRESDPIAPINIYGASKWEGEQMVRQFCEKYIILRVSAVFGTHGNNFVKTILRIAKGQKNLRVVSDQNTCPTPAADIAEALLGFLNTSCWGTYHYCSDEIVTWYDFAKYIVDIATLAVSVEAIKSTDYLTAAKRPAYSALDCERIVKTFNIKLPNWKKGLQNVVYSLSTP